MEEYELRKGANQQGQKGGVKKKTVRKKNGVVYNHPDDPVDDNGWVVVRSNNGKKKGRRKKPNVPDSQYTLKNEPGRPACMRGVYKGDPSSSQNKREYVLRNETNPRSPAQQKLLYVSKYNKGKEQQRR